MTYAEILQELMDERGMKQADLARKIDTNRSTVKTMLNGKYEPKLRTAKKVADALGVSLEYFTDRMGL